MKKVDNVSVVTGIVLIILGAVMSIVSLLFVWPLIFYSVGALVIGIVILLTLRQQDYIEPIKKNKKEKD